MTHICVIHVLKVQFRDHTRLELDKWFIPGIGPKLFFPSEFPELLKEAIQAEYETDQKMPNFGEALEFQEYDLNGHSGVAISRTSGTGYMAWTLSEKIVRVNFEYLHYKEMCNALVCAEMYALAENE